MRNYIDFYSGRVNLGGNYNSFIDSTEAGCRAQVQTFIDTFGGNVDWWAVKGYFLMNDANVIALLKNWVTHYPSAFGSVWAFFQDGLKATKSPRDTWSGGQ